MMVKGRILIVDDDAVVCSKLEAGLMRKGFNPTVVMRAEAAIEKAKEEIFDVILTDINMPGLDGLAMCKILNDMIPDAVVIVLTGFGSLQTAVEAIRAGAYDFLSKPIQVETVAIALERAIEHRKLRCEVRALRKSVEHVNGIGDLIGNSPPMQAVYRVIERLYDSEVSVLITGESGTGKELAARALHRNSKRADAPFVPINVSAMPEQLLESELFGYQKGAFTDARISKRGLFLEANKGTIFLDEIGEMPISLQPKLLRALQEKQVRPLGAVSEIPYDARILAATNRDLPTALEEGKFREDLYYRLNVIQLPLPPLRDRGADILLLAQHFISQISHRTGKQVHGISEAAAKCLMSYHWPGNVRELRNCMERAVALTRFDQIAGEDLPEGILHYRRTSPLVSQHDISEFVPLEEIERLYILKVLEGVQSNRTTAARILGLDRKTLRRKLERYGVSVTDKD